MDWLTLIRLLHVLGACVLIGFHSYCSDRTADYGHHPSMRNRVEPYRRAGVAIAGPFRVYQDFWLPIVVIQAKMRDEALKCVKQGIPLSALYQRLFRVWFTCDIPAFIAIIALLRLMISKTALFLW